MKLFGAIKLGLGFYVGYELAKIIDILSVEATKKIKKKKEKKIVTCLHCGKRQTSILRSMFPKINNNKCKTTITKR